MLYHYALLPDIFRPELLAKSPNFCTIIKQLLGGLCDNGLIANLHGDAWIQHLREKMLPGMPPQTKDRVETHLKRLIDRNRLVTCAPFVSGEPRSHEDWLEAAVDVHDQSNLQGIILTKSLLDRCTLPRECFMELSSALDLPQWERPHSKMVSMKNPAYSDALAPLLHYARTVDLIDPYMNPRLPRFFNVVKMCAGLLGKRRYRPTSRRITIHAGEPQDESVAERLNAWQNALSELNNSGAALRFKVFLWSDYGAGEDFHDRYLVTDQCCVSIARGLDIRQATTSWSLQEESVWEQQVNRFRATSSVYRPLGSIEVLK